MLAQPQPWAARTARTTEPATGTQPRPAPDAAAVGVVEVVDENMANAARTHAVESGKDLTGYSMVAFGGRGAPCMPVGSSTSSAVDEVLVPPGAGVGSAIGFLLAPFSYEATRSFYTTSDDFDTAGVRMVLDELAAEAEAFVRMGTTEAVTTEREVLMRYRGQGWEIPVTLPQGDFDEIAAQELTHHLHQGIRGLLRSSHRRLDHRGGELVGPSVLGCAPRPRRWSRWQPASPWRRRAARLVHDPASGGKVTTIRVRPPHHWRPATP